MSDVKDMVKGFMKKVSSSPSGKFKGQGRVLGSSSTPHAPSAPPLVSQSSATPNPRPPSPPREPRSPPREPRSPDSILSSQSSVSNKVFTPFQALVSSGKRTDDSIRFAGTYECPICTRSFGSEEQATAHVDTCLPDNAGQEPEENIGLNDDRRDDMQLAVAVYLSGSPSDGSVEIITKLFGNLCREPENEKFRRVRMSNPKIKEAVGEVNGGLELLRCVGFNLGEEEGEVWATMPKPEKEQVSLIKQATEILAKRNGLKVKGDDMKVESPSNVDVQRTVAEPKKIDRQVRVFFLIPGSSPAKIELPDSFYDITAMELKREAELRKKKLADSQLLIPKSLKEKQMKAAKRKYKAAIIRIQFPDGVLLQGVFLPWESTTALYKFVSAALKDPSMEFELLKPIPHKRRVIPRLPSSGNIPVTIEEEELVPSALVKFKAIETDCSVFIGLTNELLEASEPLKPEAAAPY